MCSVVQWLFPDLSARMEFFEDGPEPAFFDMGVDLGGGDVGMAEQFLDDAQVGASAEQMGRKAVAHEVGIDIRFDARACGVLLDELPNPLGSELFPAHR